MVVVYLGYSVKDIFILCYYNTAAGCRAEGAAAAAGAMSVSLFDGSQANVNPCPVFY